MAYRFLDCGESGIESCLVKIGKEYIIKCPAPGFASYTRATHLAGSPYEVQRNTGQVLIEASASPANQQYHYNDK